MTIGSGCSSVFVSTAPAAKHSTSSATPTLLSFNCGRSGFIALSPLFFGTIVTIVKLLQEILDREAGGARPRHEVADDLRETALALDLVMLHLPAADKRARPLLGLEHLPDLHFAVRPRHRVGIDRKVDG